MYLRSYILVLLSIWSHIILYNIPTLFLMDFDTSLLANLKTVLLGLFIATIYNAILTFTVFSIHLELIFFLLYSYVTPQHGVQNKLYILYGHILWNIFVKDDHRRRLKYIHTCTVSHWQVCKNIFFFKLNGNGKLYFCYFSILNSNLKTRAFKLHLEGVPSSVIIIKTII